MNPDQEQSDLGPYCLQYYRLLKNISRQEQTTKLVTGRKRVDARQGLPCNSLIQYIKGVPTCMQIGATSIGF